MVLFSGERWQPAVSPAPFHVEIGLAFSHDESRSATSQAPLRSHSMPLTGGSGVSCAENRSSAEVCIFVSFVSRIGLFLDGEREVTSF